MAGVDRSTLVLIAASVAGMLIAGYLTATKLAGGLPACGPVHGCETVALSEYSEILGIPVAVLGLGFSIGLLAAALWSIRVASRTVLYAVYGMSLFGVLFVAYLTYLELFVIHAVCVWCVGYAISIVVAFAASALRLRSVRGTP